MADSSVKGLEELIKSLEKFPVNVQKNVVTGAIRAGGTLIKKEAQLNVSKDTGSLKKSITVVKRRSKNKNLIIFSVVPKLKNKHGYLAHFFEFGTSKMAANPFLRPAYENKGKESIVAVRSYMAKRIEKEIQKAKQ